MFKFFFIAVFCTLLFGAPLLANAADDFVPAELLEKAELDDNTAQADICSLYNSAENIGKNDQEGFKWCTIAARRGSAEAQYHLANMLLDGRGYQKDETLATKWLEQAAMQEYAEAQYLLAKMYFNGMGVERDLVEAYKWVNLSTTNPNQPARSGEAHRLKGKMEWQMSRDQMQQGEKRAAAWRPSQ